MSKEALLFGICQSCETFSDTLSKSVRKFMYRYYTIYLTMTVKSFGVNVRKLKLCGYMEKIVHLRSTYGVRRIKGSRGNVRMGEC